MGFFTATPTCGCNTRWPCYFACYMCLAVVPRAYPHNIHVYQAAKGMNASYDILVGLLGLMERFLRRLDIYAQISHPPTLDEMMANNTVELLTTLALVTKELKQGRPSKSMPVDISPCSTQRSKTCKETTWREGRRGGTAEPGPTHKR